MRLIVLSLILASMAGAAVAAQPPGPKVAAARQEQFKQLGAAFKALNDELKAGRPDGQVIADRAARVKLASARLPTWFPKGSGPEAGPKIYAKPEVWSDPAGFAAAVTDFQLQADKLRAVSSRSDLDATRAQVRLVGGTCKGCHDKFRAEQH